MKWWFMLLSKQKHDFIWYFSRSDSYVKANYGFTGNMVNQELQIFKDIFGENVQNYFPDEES